MQGCIFIIYSHDSSLISRFVNALFNINAYHDYHHHCRGQHSTGSEKGNNNKTANDASLWQAKCSVIIVVHAWQESFTLTMACVGPDCEGMNLGKSQLSCDTLEFFEHAQSAKPACIPSLVPMQATALRDLEWDWSSQPQLTAVIWKTWPGNNLGNYRSDTVVIPKMFCTHIKFCIGIKKWCNKVMY